MIKPIAYYKLVVLCNELKEKHKIKIGATIPRYDCIEYSGEYEGINPFINKKGMFYLNLFLAGEIIKANEKRLSEFVLRNSNYNFSSMYFENPQNPNICYTSTILQLYYNLLCDITQTCLFIEMMRGAGCEMRGVGI